MDALKVRFDFREDEVQRDELRILEASLELLTLGVADGTLYVTRCFRKRDNALVFAVMAHTDNDRFAVFATICPNDLAEFHDLHTEHSIDA